ncbi:MAG: aryl-sulfate sulfotransferase [Bacteroidota bacterium]|nr:aryl-sulfate sulfotransferase [Bacteroidota bacterium]
MKRFTLVLVVMFLSLIATNIFSQYAAPRSTTLRNAVAFVFPKDGDLYVPTRSTIAFRLAPNAFVGAAPSDFSFSVGGEQSGLHSGKVVIADDGQTVIFKPDAPFALNEVVHVSATVTSSENITPFTYSFRTTEMSDATRDEVLYEIQQREQVENTEGTGGAPTNNDQPMSHCVTDSLPCFLFVDSVSNPSQGDIFFTATNLYTNAYSFIGILSNTGAPEYYHDVPRGCENFKVLGDNTVSYFAQTSFPKSGVITGEIERMDENGKIIKTYQCGNGYTTDYHDFQLLPNGHALLLSFDPEYVDMTKVIADCGAKTRAKVTGAIIQEIDKDGNVVFQWRSWDHVNITDATHESFTSSFVDYVHINTATFDTDGNIIASFRHMDEVAKISRTDTTMIWRWGGKHNQFTFLGDTLKFSHQHNPSRIANGHITLWDNGNYRLIDTTLSGFDTIVNRPFSRAVEFELDETNHIAKTVWEYRNVPYSSAGGDVERLPNGNTFMGFGIQTFPAGMEITPTGEKVFQISLAPGAWCYRMQKFPSYQYPFMYNSAVKSIASDAMAIAGVYPNPASSSTSIACMVSPGNARVDLIDVLGHTVRSSTQLISQSGPATFPLSVSGLPNGMYYCKLSQNGRVDTKTVIVQR